MFRPDDTPLLRLAWPGRTDILVKDEGRCPTGTFKDRLAWRLLDILKGEGWNDRTLVTTITLGNTAVSLAAAFNESPRDEDRPQILGIFPASFSQRTIGPDNGGCTMRGTDVFSWLDRHGARWVEYPLDEGYLSAGDARRIAVAEGLGFDEHRDITNGIGVPAYESILLEALAQGAEDVDCVIVPVGAGILFDEFVGLLDRTGRRTRVLGVTTLHAASVADKIYAKYSPYYSALERAGTAYHSSNPRHRVIAIEDDAVQKALRGLPSDISAEPSAAAAFVPLDMPDQIGPTESVLVVNTGNGIPIQRQTST